MHVGLKLKIILLFSQSKLLEKNLLQGFEENIYGFYIYMQFQNI